MENPEGDSKLRKGTVYFFQDESQGQLFRQLLFFLLTIHSSKTMLFKVGSRFI